MTTEKDLMLAGQPYIAADPQLSKERARGHQLVYEFNQISPREQDRAEKLLNEKIIDAPSMDAFIDLPVHIDYGPNIHVGKRFYANFNCTFLDSAPITIGDNVMLAPNVSLYTAGHPLDAAVRNDPMDLETAEPITIGNDVWLGGSVVVCPGVTIGNNVVVGAGAVVTKDVPDNVVVVGNPAHVLRKLTTDDHQFWDHQRVLHDQRIKGSVDFNK
ncbi:sugar O-acetyltransferase [Limosilactobacillus sp.]|uniref:sugar O-acetyltransferase n=1 Tax=Limosilactobacillus sp. TaxID=2773925 RepID=UPI00345EEF0D